MSSKIKLIAVIFVAVLVLSAALTFLFLSFILPLSKYNKALELIENGNIVEGYDSLIAMNGFKDSTEKASSVFEEYKAIKLKNAQKGDTVYLGTYEQDNNTDNKSENIEWLVLDVVNGQALLISKNVLDCVAYHTENIDITWENSAIRKWLNNDFLNSAFSDSEKSLIPTVTVSADVNPNFDAFVGNSTTDSVFLLSVLEAEKHLKTTEERKCAPTKYATQKGVEASEGTGNCWWWLRTAGNFKYYASYVFDDGDIASHGGRVASSYIGVRPALWVDLSLVK